MAEPASEARNIALFIDLENVAIGVRDASYKSFDFGLVHRRFLEKGNVIVRRAYADWSRFKEYKRPLHELGVELIDLPGSTLTGKNSADIKMVVDALELAFEKSHIDTFALVTGDSDFWPLVAKLREHDRYTIGVGVKNSTSPLLIDSCDEFILYDDLVRKPRRRRPKSRLAELPKEKREAFALVVEAAYALQRESKELHSSLVKDTIKRTQPQFNEEYHGYRSFGRLLEDARKHEVISMHKDPRSGTYVIDDVLEDAV